MAKPTDALKLQIAFLHNFGVAAAEFDSELYELSAKTGHNISVNEVRGEAIPFAATLSGAEALAVANPTLIKRYDKVVLKEFPNTNGQCWYFEDNGVAVDNLIDPRDSQKIDDVSASPTFGKLISSNGYQIQLFDGSGNQIMPTAGTWLPVYHNGLILTAKGFTPANLGWGQIKISCFRYIGKNAAEMASGSGSIEWITSVQ